jgi:hypothetical protein
MHCMQPGQARTNARSAGKKVIVLLVSALLVIMQERRTRERESSASTATSIQDTLLRIALSPHRQERNKDTRMTKTSLRLKCLLEWQSLSNLFFLR